VDVIRLPFNQYRNNNYNLPKSRYGTINLFKTDFHEQELCIEYPRQAFHFYPDPSAQVFYLAKCIYANIAQGLELGFAGAGSPISMPDTFADWYHTSYWWDEAKIVCYADTALRVVLESEEFLLCDDDSDPDPPPPPPPPDEPTDVPPGTSLGDDNAPVSDPYQGDDDDGETVPYPGDNFPAPPAPEFPQGERCAGYYVSISVVGNDGTPFNFTNRQHYGEIEFVGIDPDNPVNVIIVSHGQPNAPGGICYSELRYYTVVGHSPGFNAATFEYSITPM
jgi:hypothetical protein